MTTATAWLHLTSPIWVPMLFAHGFALWCYFDNKRFPEWRDDGETRGEIP